MQISRALVLAIAATLSASALAANTVVIRDSDAAVRIPNAVAKARDAMSRVTQERSSGASIETFVYHPDEIYKIGIKVGMFTTIELPKGEMVVNFSAMPTRAVEAEVVPNSSVVIVKLKSDAAVSATLVSDKRVYHLNFYPADGSWLQGVRWKDGSESSFYNAPASALKSKSAESVADYQPQDNSGLMGQPNFNYAIEGDPTVKPVAVWDNGRNTWIQFDSSVQALPAVFLMGPDGAEVVNYVPTDPNGKQVVVNRLMQKFVLRLGGQKATVVAR